MFSNLVIGVQVYIMQKNPKKWDVRVSEKLDNAVRSRIEAGDYATVAEFVRSAAKKEVEKCEKTN